MKKIICQNCKTKVEVNMYFYDAYVGDRGLDLRRHYYCSIKGKAICPLCGIEIHKNFVNNLSTADIVKIATRGEKEV